jgi:diacylglycerol kinase (ATP)
MTTRIILNPFAGGGRARARLRQVRSILRTGFGHLEWTVSESPEHVVHLAAEAAAQGTERVVVCGGDGTVHFAAAGLVGTDTELAILPVGTGNDIASALGISSDTEVAARQLVGGATRHIDAGEVDGRVFLCVLGVGMDTEALHVVHRSPLRRGRFLYTWAALRTLFTYEPRVMRITTADMVYEGPVLFTAVTNTRTYAGGIPISPGAKLSDGKLDLCVIPEGGLSGALEAFARAMGGDHVNMSGVVTAQPTELRIESDEPLPITLDGELTPLTTDVTIRVLPGALKVRAASPAPRILHGEPGLLRGQRVPNLEQFDGDPLG